MRGGGERERLVKGGKRLHAHDLALCPRFLVHVSVWSGGVLDWLTGPWAEG